MKLKPKKLTDEQLLQACRNRAEAGSSFVDSNLASERREVTDYYLGKKPAPMREGGSKFASQDVYLSVESMKAEIVETFGAGSNIVGFSPVGDDDVPLAKQATAYCAYVVHSQNPGLGIFQDVVHDGLCNRVGIAKVYWDKREACEEYTFDNVSQEQAVKLIQNPKVHLNGKPNVVQQEDGTVLISGEFEEISDTSQVVIEPVPPEEFIRTGRSASLDKAPYLAHRYRATLGSLVEDGYDENLVYSITGEDDDLAMDQEAVEREVNAGTTAFFNDESEDDAGRMVTVYESYIRIDFEGKGRQYLWKVVHVGDTILEKQKVADHPFVAYVPQPIPHTFFGNNYAARTIPHANTKTVLTRAIIEQAVEATNPRWMVARGGVANPRELIDNRRGGIVNVRSLTDSVAPLPQANMNPFVLQTIGMIDSDREDTTGISRLSQGLDKKALSHQNSSGLVEQLTNNSQTRTKVVARQFALQFVSALYLKVYALVVQNETEERVIEIAGSFTATTPAQWASRRDVTVDMTLGYGERDKRVEELLAFDDLMSKKNGRLYGEAQTYELMKEALEIKGIKNISRFLADPAKLGDPKPDPKNEAEIAKIVKDTEVAERQMALRETQVGDEIKRNQSEFKRKSHESAEDLLLRKAEQDRKDAETNNRIDIGLAELDILIETSLNADPANKKVAAIASPNS
jgi:hypothetical protein